MDCMGQLAGLGCTHEFETEVYVAMCVRLPAVCVCCRKSDACIYVHH